MQNPKEVPNLELLFSSVCRTEYHVNLVSSEKVLQVFLLEKWSFSVSSLSETRRLCESLCCEVLLYIWGCQISDHCLNIRLHCVKYFLYFLSKYFSYLFTRVDCLEVIMYKIKGKNLWWVKYRITKLWQRKPSKNTKFFSLLNYIWQQN